MCERNTLADSHLGTANRSGSVFVITERFFVASPLRMTAKYRSVSF